MAKWANDAIMDAALNEIKNNASQETTCSAQPASYYEAADPSPWAASQAAALGDAVRPTTRNGYVYECTQAGTTGSSEPAWPTTPGNTVTDGTVVWTCRNNLVLAVTSLAGGDMTIADGDASGRKLTVAEKSGVSIVKSGDGSHVALVDGANKRLLYVTTSTNLSLVAGGTTTINAWDVEIGDPT